MDDGCIAFKVHRLLKKMQEVAPEKCLLSASGAGFGGIA
jgi:hypothetical protein